MPDESAVPVNLRIYYTSNFDTYCNYTSEYVLAGSLYMISLDFNQTVRIGFSHNNTFVYYNVFTYATPEEYKPIDLTVDRQTYLDDLTTLGWICAGYGVLGVYVAVKVRKQ